MAAGAPIHLRVLTWNIGNFTATRFRGREGPEWFNFIVDTLVTLHPDICVITELMTAAPEANEYDPAAGQSSQSNEIRGRLIQGAGVDAITNLYQQLNTKKAEDAWSLVPPRNLSASDIFEHGNDYTANECVGVLFRATKLQFLGPDYNTNQNNQAIAQSAPPPADYPPPWNQTLPSAAVTPPGAAAAVQQNQLSGRLLSPGSFREFDRAPFYTLFGLATPNAPLPILIHLVSAHLSVSNSRVASDQPVPGSHQTKRLLGATTEVVESWGQPPFNEGYTNYCVVAGDFNSAVAPVFGPQGYRVALVRSAANPLKTSTNYTGLGTRHDKLLGSGVYPGYGYLQDEETDNIMVNPAPAKLHKYIANPIVGSAYKNDLSQLSNKPGEYVYPPQLKLKTSPDSEIGQNLIPKLHPDKLKGLMVPLFHKARGASDHLPLMVDLEFQ